MSDPPQDFRGLMKDAKRVRQRMREIEVALGMVFPLHVRFVTALDGIEVGLAVGNWLEVAVGYLMLREIVDEVQSKRASLN